MHQFKLLIGGHLVAGDSTMSVVNPATGKTLTTCPRASVAQAHLAVAAAKEAFPAWSAEPLARRRSLLNRLGDALQERNEEFAILLTQEQGKPIAEARREVAGAVAYIRYFGGLDLPVKVLEDSDVRHVEQHLRPLGIVVAITPWNFPLSLACGKLAPALLMGNAAVVKPAPTTPLTTLLLGELCAEIFPPGVVNVIADQNDLGAALTAHPDVRKVSFTGSSATGKSVMASAAGTLKRVTLELGGNDAAIVLDDVDPAQVAPAIFKGAFTNNGQVCLAIKRLYVHESIHDEMCAALGELADAQVVGDGLQPGTQIGPLQNRMQFDKLKDLLEDVKRCGLIVAGGTVLEGDGFYLRPTIVRDVREGDRIVDEEQFGPILPVVKYSDPEDALRRANATVHGLGGSVWSKDSARAKKLAERLECGTAWVNQHMVVVPGIPFGGAKQSGIGVELSVEGLNEFAQLQIVNIVT
ncbi:aldehyde dehydrogenase family protein [Variovorax sp. LARHSF232]